MAPADQPPSASAKPAVRTVGVVPSAGGFTLAVDGKTLRTPLGTEIAVPSRALAEAIATELRAGAATGAPRAAAVPLVRMAATALDRIGRQRADIERQLVDYAETELLCHRADHPADLVARQNAAWQPLLDWLAHRHDALLAVTTGVVAKPQNAASLEALRRALAGLDIWRLAGLSVAVQASGSLVIGLALVDGRVDAGEAFDAAELEASYQIQTWGEDWEATQRRAGVRAELELAERFLRLLA